MMQFSFLLLIAFAVKVVLVHAELKDFISIDCGAVAGYIDAKTGIPYFPDSAFVQTGITKEIDASYKTNTLEQQFHTVRSFPEGTKNCYTLTTQQVSGYNLVRARFMYGNYDQKNQVPQFDLYIGVNFWTSVKLDKGSTVVTKEIINVPASNVSYVCLVNTGLGTPFISVLELRPLQSSIYAIEYGSFELHSRWDMGSQFNQYRYPYDVYDRIWEPYINWNTKMAYLSTNRTIGADQSIAVDIPPPSIVMSTAVTPSTPKGSIDFHWKPDSPTDQYYLHYYFSELQQMQTDQLREFNVYLNDENRHYDSVVPTYLYTYEINDPVTVSPDWFNVSIRPTSNSTLPPILNAFESYIVRNLILVGTNQSDVDALKNIRTTYKVKKNWQGDPCVPQDFSWEGVNCSNAGDKPYDYPRIIVMDLSSSGLSGEISTDISKLTSLVSLDLSHNNLNGAIPDFLSQMTSLKILNLSGNKLRGTIPSGLLYRSNQKTITLSVDGNPGLCYPDPCKDQKKKNKIVVALAALASGLVVSAIAIVAIIFWRIEHKKNRRKESNRIQLEVELPESVKRVFKYSEVSRMTKNFNPKKIVGGFGTVYRGRLDGTDFAVKKLSHSSAQGYKDFQSEAKSLMEAHHTNLINLVGYCQKGYKLYLVYEFMANGNLKTLLSDQDTKALTWERRLRIALDTAHGLEYLHNGCKPSIIHGNIKPTNILLDKEFNAKLGDYCLPRDLPTELIGPVPVQVVGSSGYCDPASEHPGKLSEKSDVYAFGVVLLEIISGRPAIAKNPEKTRITHWVETKSCIEDIIDPRLGDHYFDKDSVGKAVEVAMDCISSVPANRPDMKAVVAVLENCLEMETERRADGRGTEATDEIEVACLNLDTNELPRPI